MHDVFLSHSSLPNEGLLQITTENGTKSVCWESLDISAPNIICRQLGYAQSGDISSTALSSDTNNEIFSGSIKCNRKFRSLLQCSIISSTAICSNFSYIKCKFLNKKPRACDSPYFMLSHVILSHLISSNLTIKTLYKSIHLTGYKYGKNRKQESLITCTFHF